LTLKRFLRHSIDFLLFSNCWVALSVAVLIIGFAHYYCITDCYLYGAFSFLGTFATYNFHRLVRNKSFQRAEIATARGSWLARNRILLIVCCTVSAITAGIIFFFLPIVPASLVLLAGCGFVIGFYAVPIPVLNRSLRQLSGLKSAWIVLVWAILLIIPLVNREKTIHWIDVLHVSLFAFAQIIPFDIRDVPYDPPRMRTLPQLAGIRNARLLGTVLIVAITASLINRHGFHWAVLLPVSLSLAGLWWKQRPKNVSVLELIWDGALPALGVFYYALDCVG
jgi:hypothetical protein